jgi:hypothetical protein
MESEHLRLDLEFQITGPRISAMGATADAGGKSVSHEERALKFKGLA